MGRSDLAPAWLPYPETPEDAHRLDSVLWAAGVERRQDGVTTVQGVPVDQLAEEFGTPLLVLDEDDFRSRARSFRHAFSAAFEDLCGGVDVYYASKSLLTVEVARWAAEEGLRVDTASGGELAIALRGGVAPAEIGLHGNNKSDAEILRALNVGVGRIVVDSLDELRRVAELAEATGRRAPVMLRLTPGVHAHTHDYIATAHEDQKFGLSLAPARQGGASPALEAVHFAHSAESIEFLGLHCHIGSQIFEAAGFGAAAEKLLTFIAEIRRDAGIVVEELDLGGGHGIAYTPADTPRHPEEIAQTLAALMTEVVDRLGIDCPRVSIEPGRAISGPAGFTLYTVGVTKSVQVDDDHARRYVAVDGGMSDNPRPVLYDADYTAVLASRVSAAEPTLSRVVGKHCESGDIVVRDGYLPEDVGRGDLLAVPATGAYTHVMSSNYNMLPRPAIVAVTQGTPRLIIRRETEEDLFAREVGLGDETAPTQTTTDPGGS
ncbi:MAG: diaminopimelate decarboxylase [Micrococcaceae bacterium]